MLGLRMKVMGTAIPDATKVTKLYSNQHTAFPVNLLDDLHVYTYGPGSCMDERLAKQCEPYITSVIRGHDIVPRLNHQSLKLLQKR